MNVTVFYAWQMDNPRRSNKDLISEATLNACRKLTEDPANPWTVTLDMDTQGEPGMCDIPETILQKIRASDIFLADLTFVTKTKQGKNMPNANVIFELGYAARHLGFRSLVAVMNTTFGRPDGQIFDIKRRASIKYRCDPAPSDYQYAESLAALTEQLTDAFSRTIRKVTEARRKKKLLADDSTFRADVTGFSERVCNGRFHEFTIKPASLILIHTTPKKDLDLKAIHLRLNEQGFGPTIIGNTITWSTPRDKTRRYELTIDGKLFHAYGGDHESWRKQYATSIRLQQRHAEKYGKTTPPFVRSSNVQTNFIRHVHESCELLFELGVPLPYRIGLTLIGTSGTKFIISDSELSEPCSIGQVSLKPLVFQRSDDFADKRTVANALYGQMDELLRHYQQLGSPLYNANGEWNAEI
jgi:hypothetical protein